jgi:hypothetical protein
VQAGGPDAIILGVVSGGDCVGLHAGDDVIVILHAVRHVTFMFDTGRCVAVVLGVALGRDGEFTGLHAGSLAVIVFGATMSLSLSPFMADMVPGCKLAAPTPLSSVLLVTSLSPSTMATTK